MPDARSDDPLRGRLRLGAPDSFGLPACRAFSARSESNIPSSMSRSPSTTAACSSQRLNDRELDVAILADPEIGRMWRWSRSARSNAPGSPARGFVCRAARSGPGTSLRHEIFTNPEPSNLMTLVRDWFATAGLEVAASQHLQQPFGDPAAHHGGGGRQPAADGDPAAATRRLGFVAHLACAAQARSPPVVRRLPDREIRPARGSGAGYGAPGDRGLQPGRRIGIADGGTFFDGKAAKGVPRRNGNRYTIL